MNKIYNIAVARVTCLLGLTLSAAVIAQSPAPLPQPAVQLFTSGSVRAVAPLSDGGVIFGGDFSFVNGVPRANIARLIPDGSLNINWNPGANGSVRVFATDRSGNLYVGGRFNTIGGLPRNGIAKLSIRTGTANANWNPGAGGSADVTALLLMRMTTSMRPEASLCLAVTRAMVLPKCQALELVKPIQNGTRVQTQKSTRFCGMDRALYMLAGISVTSAASLARTPPNFQRRAPEVPTVLGGPFRTVWLTR